MTERIAVGGLEIAYEDVGSRDAPALILVHGFTGHRDDFKEVLEELAASRRVLVPDLRGHGDSGRAADAAGYTFEAVVGDLLGFADALDVGPCDWLGHSMGGMVMLRLALSAPERLRSLVLLGTGPEAAPSMTTGFLEKAIAYALEEGMSRLQERAEAFGRKRPDPVIQTWADRYWPHHRRRFLAMDPQAYAGFGHAMIDQEPVTARLAELAMPVSILIGGRDDDFVPGSEEMARRIPGARCVVFPEAGHHPHQEAREAWLGAMRAHLEAVDGV